jgi:glucose-6-phosphate 1-dehydrogenase
VTQGAVLLVYGHTGKKIRFVRGHRRWFDADSVREQKVQVFRSIGPMSVDDVARFTVRGQYGSGMIDGKRVPGYRQEPGVNPNSTTETYAAVKFQIENWRWAGVPFYIRTGKRLARNLIRVHLKPTPQALFASTRRVLIRMSSQLAFSRARESRSRSTRSDQERKCVQ